MKSVALKAYPRSQVQRAEVTKLRRAGRVPATIYGRQAKPQNLEVGFDEITDLLHHSASENLLVDLAVASTQVELAKMAVVLSTGVDIIIHLRQQAEVARGARLPLLAGQG